MSNFTSTGRSLASDTLQQADTMAFSLISDTTLRDKAKTLSGVFPQIKDVYYLRDCLHACKSDVEDAANLMFGSLPEGIRSAMSKLLENTDAITVREAFAFLIECRGNLDEAINRANEYNKAGKPPAYVELAPNLESAGILQVASQVKTMTDLKVEKVQCNLKFLHTTDSTSSKGRPPNKADSDNLLITCNTTTSLSPDPQTLETKDTQAATCPSRNPTNFGFLESAKPTSFSEALTKPAERLRESIGGTVSLDECERALALNNNDIDEAAQDLLDNHELYADDCHASPWSKDNNRRSHPGAGHPPESPVARRLKREFPLFSNMVNYQWE
jgi:hypothetical protein